MEKSGEKWIGVVTCRWGKMGKVAESVEKC